MKRILFVYTSPILLLSLIALIGVMLVVQIKKNFVVNFRANKVQVDIRNIQKENEKIRAQISSFESEEIIDREARQRLNFKKEGENVVVIIPPKDQIENIINSSANENGYVKPLWQRIREFFSLGEHDSN